MRDEKNLTKQGVAWLEAQKEWLNKFGYLRDMLQSPNGTRFMADLKKDTLDVYLYAPGMSFDEVAFGLGKLHVYMMLERIQKGEM